MLYLILFINICRSFGLIDIFFSLLTYITLNLFDRYKTFCLNFEQINFIIQTFIRMKQIFKNIKNCHIRVVLLIKNIL